MSATMVSLSPSGREPFNGSLGSREERGKGRIRTPVLRGTNLCFGRSGKLTSTSNPPGMKRKQFLGLMAGSVLALTLPSMSEEKSGDVVTLAISGMT